MDKYTILAPQNRGAFAERLAELYIEVGRLLDEEKAEERHLQFCKIFLSDAQNQYQQLVESELYQELIMPAFVSVIEQPPLDGSKITLLLQTSSDPCRYMFQSFRLSEEETHGQNSYLQTMMLFEKYLKWLDDHGLTLNEHCVRTWLYVADIDVNYQGMVKARNDIFRRYGLTIDTHFIASTGIGGFTETRSECVALDVLTYPEIHESDKFYLQALDHLNPTHEYGVAFERGTRLTLDGKRQFFISGTASIDKHGHVIYMGDIRRQTARLLENIGALLKDGGATMNDIRYFIVYLRDFSDREVVESFLSHAYPTIPHVLVHAKVCRPEWLVEMECSAEVESEGLKVKD